MTHPSDIAGLSESKPLRRDYLKMMRAHVDEGEQLSHRNGLDLLAEVERQNTALDSLTARVEELEAERDEARAAAGLGCDAHNGGPHSVMSDGSYKFCTACGETIRTPSLRERARAAESRALRAEQQRDEAYERAARVAEMGMLSFTDLLENEKVCASRNALETATICAKAAREIADAIRRLSSGPEGGEKPQEPTGWRPINSAPKDGREALVFRPLASTTNDQPITVKRLIGGNHYCWPRTVPEGQTPYNPTDGACHVTHWMPLPAAPTGTEG